MIPYGKQSISDEDIAAVVEALQSDYLTCGPRVEAFEMAFAEYVGAKHAVVVCNATAALHLAMLAAGIGKGDRVITSPNTFLSSANCAAFVGAIPDFCDIDSATYTMDAESLRKSWSDDVKAVIPVAYAGQSADMKAIAGIAREKRAVVIEDASHGTGGGFVQDGKTWKQGGHPWADMTIFSFHPVKTLTMGEGGIVVTNDDAYSQKLRMLRTHGMSREASSFQGLGSEVPVLQERGPWYYEMQELGHNFRITDIQCALGLSQLKKLPDFVSRRREIVALYNTAFVDLPWLKTPKVRDQRDRDEISWHLYTVQIDFEKLGKLRSDVMSELQAQGVGTQVLYIPVYLQPWYRETYGYRPGKCPNAESYYSRALSLPLFPEMTDSDLKHVIKSVTSYAIV
ncbi:UDP-4-amino-4,6-dideoxy-N-acetyl-beta-L-altrosamine transaminase [Akkermansiaceae bacterium]|nr:UDP-4-amino-4,6-dideoxy-N-acetyl-beta-L-altrosamine transaminase [Akkermansiaceae bacterium]